jgi:hypothetical protein
VPHLSDDKKAHVLGLRVLYYVCTRFSTVLCLYAVQYCTVSVRSSVLYCVCTQFSTVLCLYAVQHCTVSVRSSAQHFTLQLVPTNRHQQFISPVNTSVLLHYRIPWYLHIWSDCTDSQVLRLYFAVCCVAVPCC